MARSKDIRAAPRYPQYLEAAAAARRVVGVSTVDNNLQVALPESDYRDDAKLTTAANNALAANVTVPDNVEATADDGNITLTGTVPYGTERAAAEAAVSGLVGVRNVMNDVRTWAEHDAVVGAALMARGVIDVRDNLQVTS